MNRPTSIRDLWTQVKHRYQSGYSAPDSPEEILAAEKALQEHYAQQLKQPVAFAFPEALKEFLGIVGPELNCVGSYGERAYGFYWYDAAMIASDTIDLNDLWWDEYEYQEAKGLWACIAHWSDKHDIWICCQPQHPQFGKIVDCHDGHPWVDQDPETDSLAEFLALWGNWHDS
jgi:hypothetical protein